MGNTFLAFLQQYSVFRLEDLLSYFPKYKSKPATLQALLRYYKHNGRIGSIGRGVYYTIPLGSPDVEVNPYLGIATKT